MKPRTAEAPAKLNLTLRVTGVRPDGFHELESLVALTDLCDTLHVTPRADDEIRLTCDAPGVPVDDTNLVVRAARALAAATGCTAGVDIRLHKRIPAGAGLGGGSSDAATTLKLLNELWDLHLSPAELAACGATIGSDVALFFYGPVAVMRGRGEQVTAYAERLHAWGVLVLPALHCATGAVYGGWDTAPTHVATHTPAEVLGARTNTAHLMDLLGNDLEPAALRATPALAELKTRIETAAGGPVRVTGSGAGMFRLFAEEAAATAWAAAVRDAGGARTEVVRVG